MAYLATYATGFEGGLFAYYTENGYTTTGNVLINSVVANLHRSLSGIGGNYSMSVDGSLQPPAVSSTSRWVHFWFKATVFTGAHDIQFSVGGLRQFTVRFNANAQRVDLYRDFTLVATSVDGAWIPTTPHWLAIHLVAASAGGLCTVFIDGVQAVTFSGDTAEQAADGWSRVSLGGGFFGFNGITGYVDDLLITDDDGGAMTTPLAEAFGYPIFPDAVISGNLTGVPIVGANRYQNIDEQPASQTDYNLAVAVNDEDLYSLTTPATPTTVYAVAIWAEAARDGAITQGSIRTVSGASDTYGTAYVLPAAPSYGTFPRVHARNPDGDVAWTLASITALQVGLKFT